MPVMTLVTSAVAADSAAAAGQATANMLVLLIAAVLLVLGIRRWKRHQRGVRERTGPAALPAKGPSIAMMAVGGLLLVALLGTLAQTAGGGG